MSNEHEVPTLRQFQIPTALVVGGSEDLIRAVSEAALGAQVLVAECTVADANTTAAQMRPLVIVLSDDVYSFDPDGFDALARDIRAMLLRVPVPIPTAADIEIELTSKMLEAENRRPSWTGAPPDV